MNIVKNFTLHRKYLEFIPALFNLLWGFWIGNTWWAAFASSSAFSMMNKLAPEWVWGWSVGLVGLFQSVALFTNRLKLRLVAAFFSVFTLVSMSVLFGFGNYRSTAVINYAMFAFCAWLGYTEILSNIKEERGKTAWK